MGYVSEYVEKLSGLVNQLIAYELRPIHFIMPRALWMGFAMTSKILFICIIYACISACALTLLQEELADSSKRKESRKLEYSWYVRQADAAEIMLVQKNSIIYIVTEDYVVWCRERRCHGLESLLMHLCKIN